MKPKERFFFYKDGYYENCDEYGDLDSVTGCLGNHIIFIKDCKIKVIVKEYK
jgi:hypothetical protein